MSEESPPFSLLSLWPFRSGRGHVTARPPSEEEVGQESAETGSDFLATELLFRAVFLPKTKTREDKNPTFFFFLLNVAGKTGQEPSRLLQWFSFSTE